MNAEAEMQHGDGLGGDPGPVVDQLDELRRDCGYSPDGEDDGVDALIDYKDALEDRLSTFEADLARTEAALTQCQHISHDTLATFGAGTTYYVRMLTLQNAMEKIQGIAEGQKADPDFVAMLRAADKD